MKKLGMLMVFVSALNLPGAKSQVTNSGGIISITSGALLFVDGTFKNESGSILNDGKLLLTGDWQNNDPSFPVFNKLSTGLVELTGGPQLISGTSKTEFPSLVLSGTGKKTIGINTDINRVLTLNDHELSTDQYVLTLVNSSPDAILRTTGFVSTDNRGQLNRSMNSITSYVFPLGSSANGSVLYRPISVELKDAIQNNFSASFIKADPSSQGYNRQSKHPDVETVFDKYFFILDQNGASNLSVKFYQNTSEDGNLKQLVKWDQASLWENAGPSAASSGSFGDGLNQSLTFTSTKKITKLPFTLAEIKDDLFVFFNAFSPDGDGKNDKWEVRNLDLYPNNDLKIFNRWGDEVFKVKNYSSEKAWDGGNLNAGTYFYILNVNVNGVQKAYKGFITMVKKD